MTLRLGELCAGYGGLGLALDLAGIKTELVWYSEHNPHPDPEMTKQPAARVAALNHPTAPNLGDLRDITDPEPVDIITAGFPCQPSSTAGRQQGIHDKRWLIDEVCRVAATAQANWLILENVGGLLATNDGDAMAAVCAALARTGFSRWEWSVIRASDVGAPHMRTRWFCVATSDTAGEGLQRPVRPRRGMVIDSLPAIGAQTPSWLNEPRYGHLRDFGPALSKRGSILERPSPEPLMPNGVESAWFYEWLMGLPEGWVCKALDHGDTEIKISRRQAIHVLGAGVVPQQAAHAITHLLERTP